MSKTFTPISNRNIKYRKVISFSHFYIRKHNFKSVKFIFAILGIFIGLVGGLLSICQNLDEKWANTQQLFDPIWARIIFNFLLYFTNLTNILLIVYYILFLTAYRTRIFNSNSFTIAINIYINLVMIVYWIFMFPYWLMGQTEEFTTYSIIYTLIYHLVTPIFHNVHTYANSNYPYDKNEINKNLFNCIYGKIIWFVLWIYVVVYGVILISVNFTPLPNWIFRGEIEAAIVSKSGDFKHFYYSIYGTFSNINSKCYNWDFHDLEQIKITNDTGSFTQLTMIFPVAITFILIEKVCIALNNWLNLPKALVKELKKINDEHLKSQRNLIEKYWKKFISDHERIFEKR